MRRLISLTLAVLLIACGSREQSGDRSETRVQCQIIVSFANWYADQLGANPLVFAIGEQVYGRELTGLQFRTLGQDNWTKAPAPAQHLLVSLTTRRKSSELRECPEFASLANRSNTAVGSDAVAEARKIKERGYGSLYSKQIVTMALPAFDLRTGDAVLPVRVENSDSISSLGIVHLKHDKANGWRPLSDGPVWATGGVP